MKNIVVFVFACLSSISFAQPERVIIHANGRIELVTRATAAGDAIPAEPESVPVFTEHDDGVLIPGVMYRGMSESGYRYIKYPGGIVRQPDGTYEIEMYTWSVAHGPRGRLWEHEIPGSDFAEVYDAVPAPQSGPQSGTPRGGSTLITIYDPSGAPGYLSSPEQEAKIRRCIELATDRYRNILKDDAVLATFEFSWEHLGYDPMGSNTVAYSDVVESAQPFSSIRDGISTHYAAEPDDSDFFENGLYNSFPMGSSIGYARPGNATDSTNAIDITWPLRTRLIGAGNNANLQIVMNSDHTGLDPDPGDGITEVDLTGTLVHEIGHHLGFDSNVEKLDSIFEDSITVWDIFRLNAGLGAVSLTEFSGQRRELRDTEEANAALQLNSIDWIPGLSRGNTPGGDDFQSSHWKDDSITGIYLGIMDPQTTGGSASVDGRYLQPADIRAFDVMGYSIDAGDFMTVDVPVINDPAGDEPEDPALPLELHWTPQSGSISSDILVYDLGTTIANNQSRGPSPELVFRENDVTGGSLTVATSELTLLPGHRYQWHAAVYNPLGLRLTDPATFIAICRADRTGDAVINFFDMSDFLVDFDAMDPSADLNGDGAWNFFDTSAFITLYTAGCP